jgi:hypothetical protein
MQKNTNFDSAAIISGEILSRHFRSRNGKKISPAVKNKKRIMMPINLQRSPKQMRPRTYS